MLEMFKNKPKLLPTIFLACAFAMIVAGWELWAAVALLATVFTLYRIPGLKSKNMIWIIALVPTVIMVAFIVNIVY